MKPFSKAIIFGLVLGILFTFGVTVSAQILFKSPTQAPPGGNVPAPLNVGSSSQEKEGNLALNTSNLFANGLLVPFGNVGIGTTSPGAGAWWADRLHLEVAGAIRSKHFDPMVTLIDTDTNRLFGMAIWANPERLAFFSRSSGGDTWDILKLMPNGDVAINENLTVGKKLTVSTIDPVYEISGKKYATYVADVAGGVKTEVTGKFQVSGFRFQVIDFDDQKVGSDLWLFWETSNKNVSDIAVLLTPSFDGKVWYEKNSAKNQIIIKSNQDGEVSFRLTAPRKDAAQWPNEVGE